MFVVLFDEKLCFAAGKPRALCARILDIRTLFAAFFLGVPFWDTQSFCQISLLPLAAFHGELGFRAHFDLLHKVLVLSLMHHIQAGFGAPLDVQVNAQVEKGHADEWGEKLDGGGCDEEIPVVEKLSVAFPIGYDASAGYVLPADNRRSIEQEG